MKLPALTKTSTKRTAIALTCTLATAASTLVAAPAAGATSRVEGQCDEVNHVLLPVETSWGFAKHAEVGDTIGYVMTITNTFFEEGKTKIGVAVHQSPTIDDVPDTTKKIDIKPITNDGNGKYLNQNDFASIRYTYTVTEEDIQKQEVTKKLAFPISKGDDSKTICSVHFEHTQNLKSPFRTYAPWVAGALAIIGAAAGAIWFFFKDQLPQLFR